MIIQFLKIILHAPIIFTSNLSTLECGDLSFSASGIILETSATKDFSPCPIGLLETESDEPPFSQNVN